MNLNKSFYLSLLRWYLAHKMKKSYLKPAYNLQVDSVIDSRNHIAQLLNKDINIMICRWGATELDAVISIISIHHHIKRPNLSRHASKLCRLSGFFPDDPQLINKFSDLMLDSFSYTDCIGVWNNSMITPLEDYIINNYAPRAHLIPLQCIYSPDSQTTWTQQLKDKKVLVVHPFSETIEKQYRRRDLLFTDADVRLPKFELKTLKAVQSIAGEQTGFNTWFDALEYMQRQMEAIDFDIALIGAGAYGMPLAVHAKHMGKKGIHIGGALQLMFGIMGGRWENRAFPNARLEYWVRPSAAETPRNKDIVEGGCYW